MRKTIEELFVKGHFTPFEDDIPDLTSKLRLIATSANQVAMHDYGSKEPGTLTKKAQDFKKEANIGKKA